MMRSTWSVRLLLLSAILLLGTRPAEAQTFSNLLCTNGGSGTQICTQFLAGSKGGLGRAVSATTPLLGQLLAFDGGQWLPSTFSPAGIDLTGSYPNTLRVIGIQGYAVQNVAPANGQALVWSAANSRYEPQSVSTPTGPGGTLTQAISATAWTACQVARRIAATGQVEVATGVASGSGDLVIGLYTGTGAMGATATIAKPGSTVTGCVGLTNGRLFRSAAGAPVTYASFTSGDYTHLVGIASLGLFDVMIGDTQQVP